MKKLIISITLGLLLACSNAPAQDLKFKENLSKEFTLTPNGTLAIYNISGFIKVEGYSGNKIVLEIDKTLSAENTSDLEKGKSEFKLQFEQNADSLIVFIAEPYDSRPNRNRYKWNKDRRINYNYQLDFTIKVPYSMNLDISTVNNGDILVNAVSGSLHVNNVNGAIALKKVKGKTSVRTINGNVDVEYISNPPSDSDYYTLNGDLTVSYPANLSANCEYKSFNGELFTDFPEVKILPARITKNIQKEGDSIKYKLHSNTSFKIGNGGQRLHFETFNGNIFIKKQS